MNKRQFLTTFGAAAGAFGLAKFSGSENAVAATSGEFPLMKTDAEWRATLSEMQYYVLREHGTERPFTSVLNDEKRAGVFHCAACDEPLFLSETKYDSGTGWPSFWQEIEGQIGYQEDRSLFMVRTEEHCANCGGHLGHVFDDGPRPTGKRHCINGVAMVFKPADGSEAVVG
ncbi:MAG: peptide-methionine (R)-S-oxide reductase MsrB [Pseudomonadota bacterium]